MKAYRITTDSGYQWETSINPNCSHEDVISYFLNKTFDVGCYPKEKLEKVVRVERIEP